MMRESRQKNIWNPQIAFGVVAVCVLAALWLNMAKLRLGIGQSEHDVSQIPLARNLTSDQLEELRNGKPLSLILEEQPLYERQGKSSEVARAKWRKSSGESPNDTEQTSTIFSPEETRQAVEQSVPTSHSERQTPELGPSEDNSSAKPVEASESSPTQIFPSDVPRANPSLGELGQSGGGSFLEKFPGKSSQLPNLQNGPAMKEPTPAPFPESRSQVAEASLPSASELSPPPFGDLAPAPAEPIQTNSNSDQVYLVKPIGFNSTSNNPSGVSRIESTELPVREEKHPLLPDQHQTAFEAPTPNSVPCYPTRLTREGDTWWNLAQELYDDGRLFRELYSYNQDRLPVYDRIPAGIELVCPPKDVLRGAERQTGVAEDKTNTADRTYRTQAGDTLFTIAREELGQASRFGELLLQNKNRLPQRTGHLTALPAGLELKLPRR